MTLSARVSATGAQYAAGSTPQFTGQFQDAAGNNIPLSLLTSVTLSIVDEPSETIINGVSAIPIMNADRGAVSTGGFLTVNLRAADTALLTASDPAERRSLIVDFAWNNGQPGGGVGWLQFDFTIIRKSGP